MMCTTEQTTHIGSYPAQVKLHVDIGLPLGITVALAAVAVPELGAFWCVHRGVQCYLGVRLAHVQQPVGCNYDAT